MIKYYPAILSLIFSTILMAQEDKYELLTSRAIENGLYDSAIVYCNKLLEINGENSVDLCVRGSIKMKMNDTEGALGDFALAIGQDPEDPCAFFNRGNLHLYRRDYEKALDDFNMAISLDPRANDYYRSRGFVWFYTGVYEKAIRDISRTMHESSGDKTAWKMLGFCYLQLDKWEPAIRTLKHALESGDNQEDAETCEMIATCFMNLDNYENANGSINLAISSEPGNDHYQLMLGEILVKQEKFEESISSFDRAIQLNGNNPQAYFMRGRAKFALKQDGCEDLETALKLGHPNAIEAINRLCVH